MIYVIRIDINESKPYPIVRHEFRGETKQQALNYVKAHRYTDNFLDACLSTGLFNGITCHTTITEFTE